MPVAHVNLPTTKDVDTLRQTVEHQLNLTIDQINAQTGRWNKKVDSQGFTVTNLPWPVQGGDAVPLKYLQQTTNTKTRVRPPRINPTIFHVIFKAAISQNGSPLLGMSWGTSSPASGVNINGTNIITAGMVFTGGVYVQDHFPLPLDWIAPIDLTAYWLTSSGTSHPTWSIQFQSVGNGTNINGTFNAASTAVATVTSSLILVETVMQGINVNNVNPGDLMFFKFGRSDAGTDPADLLELRFDIRRNTNQAGGS